VFPKPLYTKTEVAEMMGITKTALSNRIGQGDDVLPKHVKMGKFIRFKGVDLEHWYDSLDY